MKLCKADGGYDSKYIQVTNSPITYTIPDSYTSAYMVNAQIRVFSGYTANNVTVYPMFEEGATASPYEPYTGGLVSPSPECPAPLYTIASDGNINLEVSDETAENVQSITLSTPNGLPGVPVSSGGNYTDENGQMWVCDETDLARGVYIQRIATGVVDGTVDPSVFVEATNGGTILGWEYDTVGFGGINKTRMPKLCDKLTAMESTTDTYSYKDCTMGCWGFNSFGTNDLFLIVNVREFSSKEEAAEWLASNALTFLYILATPIETRLTAEQLATYKPTTNITNDVGAHMAVKYVADPKTYIDNKFTALENAILSATT